MNYQPDVALFSRWASGGGAERVISNLANGFAEKGLSVDLIVVQGRGESAENFHPNVRLIDFDIQATSGLKFVPSSLQSARALPKLVSYLREYRPPTLMSATHFINEIALLAKQLAFVPTRVVVTEHTSLSQETKCVEQVSSRLVPITVNALYPLADEIVAVSQGVAQDLTDLMRVPHKPIQVVYNSVVTPEIYDLSQQAIDHPWFREKDRPVIVGSGRFVKQKDFASLLTAFSQFRKTHPARLVLLGNGRERNALEELAIALDITDDLWMPGFVDNPYAYVSKADLFVLSSAWEGLPTALIEAIALGIPVVSTDCPSGPSEILRHGEYGKLVPVGDVEALGAAMATALESDRCVVPQSWIQQFTPEVVIEQYMKVAGLTAPPTAIPASPQSSDRQKRPTQSTTASGQAPNSVPGLISIIIPAYNAADLVEDALDSIRQQTYDNWEVIVVEDGTQDDTEHITQTFAQQVGENKVHYLRHAVNQGLSAARNTGMAAARGEFIALLDHDDTWQPQHLEQLLTQLSSQQADIAFASAQIFHYSTYNSMGTHGPRGSEWSSFPESLLHRNYIPASGTLMRSSIPPVVGGFDPQLRRVEDLDYWLRCVEAGMRFAYLPEITNGYRQRNPKAMTSNKSEILEWHARVLRKHSVLPSVAKSRRQRIIARHHLGVARRCLKTNPLKACQFGLWALYMAPLGSIDALLWFLSDETEKEFQYT